MTDSQSAMILSDQEQVKRSLKRSLEEIQEKTPVVSESDLISNEITLEKVYNFFQHQITLLKNQVFTQSEDLKLQKEEMNRLVELTTVLQTEVQKLSQENASLRLNLSEKPQQTCLPLWSQNLATFQPHLLPPFPPLPLQAAPHPSSPLPQSQVNAPQLSQTTVTEPTHSKRTSRAARSAPSAAAASSTSHPPVTQQQQQSPPPLNVSAPMTYASAAKKSVPSFRQNLQATAEPAAKLKALLRQPITPESTQEVRSAIFSVPLKEKARKNATYAWKELVKASSGHDPLMISLLAPAKAEVFYDCRHHEAILTSLSQLGKLHPEETVTDKDIKRRARAYLNGYFKPLRLATLQGFSLAQQEEILTHAENLLADTKVFDSSRRTKWLKTIAYDRQLIQKPTMDDADL